MRIFTSKNPLLQNMLLARGSYMILEPYSQPLPRQRLQPSRPPTHRFRRSFRPKPHCRAFPDSVTNVGQRTICANNTGGRFVYLFVLKKLTIGLWMSSQHNLERSRAYEGPNVRLRRVLQKAADGHPIRIGILGGSGMYAVQTFGGPQFTWFLSFCWPRRST